MNSALKAQIMNKLAAARQDSLQYRRNAPVGQSQIAGGAALIVSVLNVLAGPHTIADAHQALRELARERRIRVFPEGAQWELTGLDREYALEIGGQARHWVVAA